jgi:tellurite resistance protein TerC
VVVAYVTFIAFVLVLLALDLGVFHKKLHAIGVKEALGWSAFWISLALAFSGVVYVAYEYGWAGLGTSVDKMTADPKVLADGSVIYNDGGSAVVKYLTGFVVEKSLAVDNLFVIAMIFGQFAVPPKYQHRVLFWGILGALLMRGAMIAVGAALVVKFSWVIYVFGGFLIFTGVKMLLVDDSPKSIADGIVARTVRRIVPVTRRLYDGKFFVRTHGLMLATPLLLVLVLVEITDVVFAVDSIPAIFAITTDPFLVFTSNVFAILGLRSLYFALANMMDRFRYLKVALAVVLVVVGGKMIAHAPLKDFLGEHFHFYVLGVIGAILVVGIVASLAIPQSKMSHQEPR